MKTAALLYAGSLTDEALRPLAGGPSAFDRCLEFARRLPGLERMIVASGERELPAGAPPAKRRARWTVDALLEELQEAGRDLDAVFLVWADQPLLDPGLASRMAENFRKYRAEYGFADGYPVGLAAEILHPRIVPALRALAASIPAGSAAGTAEPARDSLFGVIQKDINAFDIETQISPVDLRDLRLALACDTRRNRVLAERLMEAGVRDEASALELIPKRLELLRSLPAFVQVQVSGPCPQTCALCPYPVFGGDVRSRADFMPRDRFGRLLDQVVELCGDATIDLSLWGEPSLHPEIETLVADVLARSGLSLIVETSGLGWKAGTVDRLAGRPGAERLSWVVSLDAWSAELYAALRGEGFAEATAFAERLIAAFPSSAYVQIVRARENEGEIEAFWRGWKKRTENVIVQKYSTGAGLLPERKVADLSPLARRPCWHIKRDLSVLVDGAVPLCRECVRGEILLGNAFDGPDGLRRAWDAGAATHLRHVEGRYPEPCAACDEYYTYNA